MAAAAAGLLLAAGQAGAAPYWQTVSTNSNWTISGDVYSDFALSASCLSYTLAVGERRGYGGSVELRVNGIANSTEPPSTECVS
ncbi:hypothetical protein [Streptomyces curacoi]|uniref:hypothetical protein n=1 Tax=Streptomyces curacoi TaxID=146536 RepID=UPI000782A14B|nr:hypothetical protein [Streptomyces curacoi]